MTDKIKHVLVKPSRMIYANVTKMSAPKGVPNAVPKFSATFGLCQEDFDLLVPIMVEALKKETGGFTKPDDYYLAALSSKRAIERTLAKAELDGQGKADAADIMKRAENRCKLYEPYVGILTASSKFSVALAKVEKGGIVDVGTGEHDLALAGEQMFYSGAWVVPALELQAYRKKSVDAKAGVTAFLQRCLFVKDGERIGQSSSSASAFSNFSQYSDVDPTAAAADGAGW
jgi:hypothetical protein